MLVRGIDPKPPAGLFKVVTLSAVTRLVRQCFVGHTEKILPYLTQYSLIQSTVAKT